VGRKRKKREENTWKQKYIHQSKTKLLQNKTKINFKNQSNIYLNFMHFSLQGEGDFLESF
jgi:P pilus assembly chaperone PapD